MEAPSEAGSTDQGLGGIENFVVCWHMCQVEVERILVSGPVDDTYLFQILKQTVTDIYFIHVDSFPFCIQNHTTLSSS